MAGWQPMTPQQQREVIPQFAGMAAEFLPGSGGYIDARDYWELTNSGWDNLMRGNILKGASEYVQGLASGVGAMADFVPMAGAAYGLGKGLAKIPWSKMGGLESMQRLADQSGSVGRKWGADYLKEKYGKDIEEEIVYHLQNNPPKQGESLKSVIEEIIVGNELWEYPKGYDRLSGDEMAKADELIMGELDKLAGYYAQKYK